MGETARFGHAACDEYCPAACRAWALGHEYKISLFLLFCGLQSEPGNHLLEHNRSERAHFALLDTLKGHFVLAFPYRLGTHLPTFVPACLVEAG